MPILNGSASLSRFDVALPPTVTFDEQEFREIRAGAEVRESIGFLPFEPQADYQIGAARWAFRVRIDKLSPDPTAVRERIADLIRSELETTGSEKLSQRRRKELKHLAEEELLRDARPSSKIIEGVLDDGVLHLGTTSNAVIGKVLLLLRKVGVAADFKTPWNDLGDGELESDAVEALGPGQSIWGARFLAGLIGDQQLAVEPADGYAKLQSPDRKITLAGKIINDVVEYVEDGAELLTAKLTTGEQSFRLDGLSFRIGSLSLRPARGMHWTEALDDRLEQINEIWELLDRKYGEQRRGRSTKGRVLNQPAERGAPAAARSPVQHTQPSPDATFDDLDEDADGEHVDEAPENVVAFRGE